MKLLKDHSIQSILKRLVLYLIILMNFHNPVFSQENQSVPGSSSQPVMQSVFWNTVWGSTWGAVMGVSYHWLSGVQFRESVVTSTTIGGALGYGLGLYMVLNGLTFDERYLLKLPKFQLGPRPNASLWEKDKNILHAQGTSRKKPDFKWEATLFQFHF